jgi:hypothetical protein
MPWLKAQVPETVIIPDTLKHLRDFANQSRIRRLLLGLMADQLVGKGRHRAAQGDTERHRGHGTARHGVALREQNGREQNGTAQSCTALCSSGQARNAPSAPAEPHTVPSPSPRPTHAPRRWAAAPTSCWGSST